MANIARTRRSLVRRSAVLLTVVMAGGGLVALEHTATGASTGTPSSYGSTHHNGNNEGDNGKDHGSTSTTSTSMPHDRGLHCGKQHGGHHHKKFKCRVPSGGQNPGNHNNDKHGDQNKNGHS